MLSLHSACDNWHVEGVIAIFKKINGNSYYDYLFINRFSYRIEGTDYVALRHTLLCWFSIHRNAQTITQNF